jgi:Uma2 family endonuclease
MNTTQWALSPVCRISVDEYERMAGAGVLDDESVELIDGLLVAKMGKNPPHIWSVRAVLKTLTTLLTPDWTLRKEDPVRLPPFDEPEPDVALVRSSPDDYRDRIPEARDVALLVEVSESSLDQDQGKKCDAYAKGRIPVYWIVNLVNRRVEVYTDPGPDGYATSRIFLPGQAIPVVIDGVEAGRIAVADILS